MFNINKELYNDIKLYCVANNIIDIDLFCNQMINKGFLEEKYKTNIFITNKKEEIDLKPTLSSNIEKKEINNKNIEDNYGVYD